jgi:ABC-type transporter Mla subunit MlaD
MRIRLTLLLILCTFLLLSIGAGALAATRYQVETGTISGGGYQLTVLGSEADGVATGGAYRLVGPPSPGPTGSGCCCAYLPCILLID